VTDTELRRAIERCAEQNGAHVIETVLRGTRGRAVVEVFVDSETGVTVDVCSTISRALQTQIELEHLLEGAYRLDVSSPGIDRPLLHPWQYAKHVGRDLILRVAEGETVTERRGRLIAADADGITLEGGPPRRRTTTIVRFTDVREARIALPW
jgi:ribosome maturation factor RimP